MTIDQQSRRWKRSAPPKKQPLQASPQRDEEYELLDAPKPHPGRRMSEEEFLTWIDEFTRAEWVDGEVIIMSPVSDRHADIHRWLSAILSLWVEEHDLGQIRGDVLVRLTKPRALRVPEIYFFDTQRAALQSATIFEGPPDVIFEIVSPDSTSRDYRDKLKNYQASGVKEYWIIDPLSKCVEANELVKGTFRSIQEKDGVLHSKVLRNFWLRPKWFWQVPLPKIKDVLRELDAA